MTDWSRLVDYIVNYFPDPKYSQDDIRDWANKNVPAWKNMGGKDKDKIVRDRENYVYESEVEPEIKKLVEGKSRGFIERIKRFLGRFW